MTDFEKKSMKDFDYVWVLETTKTDHTNFDNVHSMVFKTMDKGIEHYLWMVKRLKGEGAILTEHIVNSKEGHLWCYGTEENGTKVEVQIYNKILF